MLAGILSGDSAAFVWLAQGWLRNFSGGVQVNNPEPAAILQSREVREENEGGELDLPSLASKKLMVGFYFNMTIFSVALKPAAVSL